MQRNGLTTGTMARFAAHLRCCVVLAGLLGAIIGLPGAAAFGSEVAAVTPYQVNVRWTATPPKLDGAMDDECWKDAQVCTNFQLYSNSMALYGVATQQTEVRLCYDARNLYVFWTLREGQMDKLRAGPAEETARDLIDFSSPTDHIELFLDPGQTRKKWIQLVASPHGIRYKDVTSQLEPAEFNPDWQVKAGRMDGGWTVEMVIPFAALGQPGEFVGTPPAGEKWGIHFGRNEAPSREISQWKPLKNGFTQVADYGTAVFEGPAEGAAAPRIALAPSEPLGLGPGTLTFNIEPADAPAELEYSLWQDGKPRETKRVAFANGVARAPERISEGGEWKLQVIGWVGGNAIYAGGTFERLPRVQQTLNAVIRDVQALQGMLKVTKHPSVAELATRADRLLRATDGAVATAAKAATLTRAEWIALDKQVSEQDAQWKDLIFDTQKYLPLPPLASPAGDTSKAPVTPTPAELAKGTMQADFAPVQARFVRVSVGNTPVSEIAVLSPKSTDNLALAAKGARTGASSHCPVPTNGVSPYHVAYLNDGRYGESSAWAPAPYDPKAWIQVDLGARTRIGRVVVTFPKGVVPSRKDVRVSTDGVVWTPVGDEDPDKQLRALTGAHTRVVWIQSRKSKNQDNEGGGWNDTDDSLIMVIDTDDGKGERSLFPNADDYAKPLLTNTGDRVVFFCKGSIQIVNWDGTGRKELMKGWPVDTWQDPQSGVEYVYVNKANPKAQGSDIWRVPIDDPTKEELVWNKGQVYWENLRLSPDGKRAGMVAGWPNCGVATFPGGNFRRLGTGCWAGIRPDDSYTITHYDFRSSRRHEKLRVHLGPDYNVNWEVDLEKGRPTHEGTYMGLSSQCANWSNNPRILADAGPFKSATGPYYMGEIWVGRFAEDLKSIEKWVRITENNRMDVFPDVWVDLKGLPQK